MKKKQNRRISATYMSNQTWRGTRMCYNHRLILLVFWKYVTLWLQHFIKLMHRGGSRIFILGRREDYVRVYTHTTSEKTEVPYGCMGSWKLSGFLMLSRAIWALKKKRNRLHNFSGGGGGLLHPRLNPPLDACMIYGFNVIVSLQKIMPWSHLHIKPSR